MACCTTISPNLMDQQASYNNSNPQNQQNSSSSLPRKRTSTYAAFDATTTNTISNNTSNNYFSRLTPSKRQRPIQFSLNSSTTTNKSNIKFNKIRSTTMLTTATSNNTTQQRQSAKSQTNDSNENATHNAISSSVFDNSSHCYVPPFNLMDRIEEEARRLQRRHKVDLFSAMTKNSNQNSKQKDNHLESTNSNSNNLNISNKHNRINSSNSTTATTSTLTSPLSSSSPKSLNNNSNRVKLLLDEMHKKQQEHLMIKNENQDITNSDTTENKISNVASNNSKLMMNTFLSISNHNDLPILSMNQVHQICERAVKERDAQLREQYDKILAKKLNEQYDSFVRFTHEQIQRRFEKAQCSYVS